MFDSIAPEYDKLNHIMSAGVDRTWRSRALKHIVEKDRPQQILDIACGTGDFSIAIAKHAHKDTFVQGLDLSEVMLDVMAQKVEQLGMTNRIKGEKGDCEQMRFDSNTFDRATIAFGIRNFEHREKALKEIGIPLPKPDEKPGRTNNRKMKFDEICREELISFCRENGILSTPEECFSYLRELPEKYEQLDLFNI